jgi:hypothetical protein
MWKGWHGRGRRELAERAPTRTRGDGLVLLLVGKVDAILVVGRIPGLVLLGGHEPVPVEVIVPVLRLGYFWEPGRPVMGSRGGLASGRVCLVLKVVVPVLGVRKGMFGRGGRTRFSPVL